MGRGMGGGCKCNLQREDVCDDAGVEKEGERRRRRKVIREMEVGRGDNGTVCVPCTYTAQLARHITWKKEMKRREKEEKIGQKV